MSAARKREAVQSASRKFGAATADCEKRKTRIKNNKKNKKNKNKNKCSSMLFYNFSRLTSHRLKE